MPLDWTALATAAAWAALPSGPGSPAFFSGFFSGVGSTFASVPASGPFSGILGSSGFFSGMRTRA